MIICYNIHAQAIVRLCFVGGLLMQHFSKQLRTRLLTLYLSAGLVMGWLPGCGSQDLEIADTVAESAVTATADATGCHHFFPAGRAGGVYRLCGAGGRHFR